MRDKKKIWLWIDPTNFCNLNCKLCYTKLSHGNSFLGLTEFITIINKLLDSNLIEIQILHLNWRGEPFANAFTVDFIEYLNTIKFTFPVHLHTNGTLLGSKTIDRLLKIDFNYDFNFYFSIDGGSPENHEKNRGENTFYQSVKNLNTLLKHQRSFKVGVYEIKLDSEVGSILSFLDKHPDEYISVRPLYPNFEEYSFYNNHGETVFDNYSVNIEGGGFFKPNLPCVFAGNSFSISPTGDVQICLVSHSNEGVIGNIFIDSVNKLIEKAELFRNKILNSGRSGLNHCRNCMKLEDPIYSNNHTLNHNNYGTESFN